MNREFVRHLLHARRHLREAALSLIPPPPPGNGSGTSNANGGR